jgi:acyl CoA:acetate/3-ketoacid CoA transferase
MNSYWAFVKTGTGGFVKVTVTADNIWIAGQILKNTYGDNLQSGPSLVN